MVVLLASIITKTGRILLARQFVEMSRVRIEGLISAFPKLLSTDIQHTFIETQNVRYVYQPLDTLYMLIITNKTSNILEDLEALQLFTKLIPEFCKSTPTEEKILERAFELTFAFDEVISLGYREKLSLPQIKTCMEMDSHEEKIFEIVKKNKEREALEKGEEMRLKFEKEKKESRKMGGMGGGMGPKGFGSSSFSSDSPSFSSTSYTSPSPTIETKKKVEITETPGNVSGLKLGGNKKKGGDKLLQAIAKEEKIVIPVNNSSPSSSKDSKDSSHSSSSSQHVQQESVHFEFEEQICAQMDKDGVIKMFEVKGSLSLTVSSNDDSSIDVYIQNNATKEYRMSTHPHIDKKKWQDNIISLKGEGKKYPVGAKKLPVLKWRYASKEEGEHPLQITAWPSVGSTDTTVVNLEYILLKEDRELRDLNIHIPLPQGVKPVVQESTGQYRFDPKSSTLVWNIALVDSENTDGQMEFVIPDIKDNSLIFPIRAYFTCSTPYCDISVDKVQNLSTNNKSKFSLNSIIETGEYIIDFE
eukprot:TRINITY_DN13622_c0_g1_i1.p1 TRINITY_DN13622_c0_g1~~TRINITY_DN13622_c0_g1_i1.p1  ORF type:complete len:529 (+),score=187.85 TRINITY_DN13622_c0_g1_i1:3-1589(+)